MDNLETDAHILASVKESHRNKFSYRRLGNWVSNTKIKIKGLCRGCSSSPMLFTTCLEEKLDRLKKNCEDMVRYSDQQVIFGHVKFHPCNSQECIQL